MRKNKHRRFIPAVEYLREPILLEAERATKLPLRLALFHLTSQADRNGVVPLGYEAIEARAPGDDFDWERIIDLLAAAGFLTIFLQFDPGHIQLNGWHRMQSPHDKEKTDLPAPPDLNRYLTPQKIDWKPWQHAAGINAFSEAVPIANEIINNSPPVFTVEESIRTVLTEAAAGNVSTSAIDITPILDLIESGIPLEFILQSVRDWVAQDQTELNSWGEEWLLTSIKTDWEVRPAAQPQPTQEELQQNASLSDSQIDEQTLYDQAHSTTPIPLGPPQRGKAFAAALGSDGNLKIVEVSHAPTQAIVEPPADPANHHSNIKADGKMYADPAFYDEPGEAPIKSLRDTSPAYNAAVEQQLAADDDTSIPPKDTAEMGGAPSGAENSLPHGAENSLPLSPAGVPWDELLAGYVAGNVAWDAGWGPRPGAPGCKVPIEMLREYGLEAA